MTHLRFLSFLAPSLPEALFETVAEHVGSALGVETSIRFERRASAPPEGEPDPFTTEEADVGFLCAPGYLRLRALEAPPVRLIPAAAVFDDPRARGRPVYFSDIVVRRDAGFTSFDDLRGGRLAFNDPCSQSGYLSLLRRIGDQAPSFATLHRSGSHLESVRLVAEGDVDAAAIDSNALALLFRREPELATRLTVLESLGPHRIQPIVASTRLHPQLVRRIAQVLRSMHLAPLPARHLRAFGVLRFVAVRGDDRGFKRLAPSTGRLPKRGEGRASTREEPGGCAERV